MSAKESGDWSIEQYRQQVANEKSMAVIAAMPEAERKAAEAVIAQNQADAAMASLISQKRTELLKQTAPEFFVPGEVVETAKPISDEMFNKIQDTAAQQAGFKSWSASVPVIGNALDGVFTAVTSADVKVDQKLMEAGQAIDMNIKAIQARLESMRAGTQSAVPLVILGGVIVLGAAAYLKYRKNGTIEQIASRMERELDRYR
jgi:hypothetical protein